MESENELNISDFALLLLDIIVILMTDIHPIRAIVLLALLKCVSNDPMIEILFILLAIVIWVWGENEPEGGEKPCSA